MTQTICTPERDWDEIEHQMRALIQDIRTIANERYRDGSPGSKIRRSAMHEASEIVRDRVIELLGPRIRGTEAV